MLKDWRGWGWRGAVYVINDFMECSCLECAERLGGGGAGEEEWGCLHHRRLHGGAERLEGGGGAVYVIGDFMEVLSFRVC